MIELFVEDKRADFAVQDYKLNMWHTLCSTWDSTSGLVQLWFDGKPSIRKFIGGSNITRQIIVLGQVGDLFYVCYIMISSFCNVYRSTIPMVVCSTLIFFHRLSFA